MDSDTEETLPNEIWLRVLRFLDPDDLYSLRTVCSSWYYYIDSDPPWIEHLEKIYGTRYAKARFVADPALRGKERFWRTARLHQNWIRGDQWSSLVGGSIGHIKQIKVGDNCFGVNLSDGLGIFEAGSYAQLWQLPEGLPDGYLIPSFDLSGNLVYMPGVMGTQIPKSWPGVSRAVAIESYPLIQLFPVACILTPFTAHSPSILQTILTLR